MEQNDRQGVDTLPADAGSVAAATASSFIEDMFGGRADPETAQPAAPQSGQPEPPEPPEQGPAVTDDGSDLMGGFEAIREPAKVKSAAPAAASQDEVPAHVVRKGEEAVKTWKAIRAENEQLKQKAVDLERDRQLKEQELDEIRKKIEGAPPADEIEKLKRALQEKEDYIGRVDVTQSKVFQETYDKPLNELFGKTVRQLMKAGHKQEQALDMARRVFRPSVNTPQAIERELPDETAVTIGALSALVEDRDVLMAKREEAIKNWRQTMEATQVEERRRASSEIGTQLTRVSEKAFDDVVKDGSWLYKRGQDPQWNEGVEARRNAAVGYIRAGKPEDLARLVFEGIAAPVYRKGYEQLKAKYDDLKAKYEAVSGRVRPGLAQGAPATAAESGAAASAAGARPRNVSEFIDNEWRE